jgi:outer membrane lipoprotein
MRPRTVIAFIATLALAACAPQHVISQQGREGVRADVPFASVIASPEEFKGARFIWGGFIVDARVGENGTDIEIVENPLDPYGGVMDTDVSGGRFIARYEGVLDPLIYEKDRLVTIAGTFLGAEKLVDAKLPTAYPVLAVEEIMLWRVPPYPGGPFVPGPFLIAPRHPRPWPPLRPRP